MNGQKLKELRKKAGLTQKDLAKIIDVYHTHISQWENGKYAISKVYAKILNDYFNKL